MTQRLSIKVTRRTAAQIEQVAAWWELNRPAAPGAIEEELERAFAFLSAELGVGAIARNVKLRDSRPTESVGKLSFPLSSRDDTRLAAPFGVPRW